METRARHKSRHARRRALPQSRPYDVIYLVAREGHRHKRLLRALAQRPVGGWIDAHAITPQGPPARRQGSPPRCRALATYPKEQAGGRR
jgi:hypothetical protein